MFNLLRWSLLGLILIQVGPHAALASEDAGVRSVFANGAGNRALSLGGAFTAIADDASAPAWNAAGLTQIKRNEFMASHATLYGLGFNEQYVFLAIPSWRWGATAFSFRHFGVDGIEQRDEFNVLLDDNLTRSEMEFAVSYAQNLGQAWSLGLTGKLRRLDFAGYSGDGLGLDLGILGYPFESLGVRRDWSRRFRLGFSIRNMIEPSLTLIRDDVPDPTGVRLGGAYLWTLAGGRSITLATDLEKTQTMGARLHAGLEVRLHPMLAIRTGLNSRGFCAGTGIMWRSATFEYSFEDNEFDSVHRMGLSMRFGTSIQARRQAALSTEEAKLQERLRLAFEEQQQRRIEELIEEAKAQKESGNLDDALETLATADALNPSKPEILRLRVFYLWMKGQELEDQDRFMEAAMRYGQALELDPKDSLSSDGLKRCRAASDRLAARSEEQRRQFAVAFDAFIADDLKTARLGFLQALELDPGDEEASAMLTRIEAMISRRVTQIVDQAGRMARAKQYDVADDLLVQAAEIDPGSPEIARGRKLLADLRQQELAKLRTSPQVDDDFTETTSAEVSPVATVVVQTQKTFANLSQEVKREVEMLYRRGLSAMEQGDSDEALRYWEIVWSKASDYQQVSENLKQEYLLRGMQWFAKRETDEAIHYWEEALRVAPSDQRTIDYLDRARMQLVRSAAITTSTR